MSERPRCGWMGASGEYVCVKPAGHTGNHHCCPVDHCPGPDLSSDGAAIGCGIDRSSKACAA
jgi:hypothetical protein